jgi:tripartite-type tricarboxylate transporter receptor subunit TctC
MLPDRYLRATAAAIALGAMAGLMPGSALAQEFPNRAIKMVVAFPPGGPTDFVARLLGDKMKSLLGQSVIIENKAGANAAIGADYVAKSEPDGYTVFFTTMGAVAINPNLRADLPYDPVRDFAPITLVVNTPEVLVVRPEMAVKTAKDLADYARSRPEGITMASTGVGSPPHLALELFQSAAKAKVLHVPYRGAAPAVTDVLGGQVDAMFADLPVLMPQIQAGKLKPIGTAASARAEVLPDVPTLDELSLPGVHVDNWYALFAPARTPAPVIAKLNAAVVAALNDPEMRKKLVQSGAFPAAGTPEALSEHLKGELARWGKIIREKGIKSDS